MNSISRRTSRCASFGLIALLMASVVPTERQRLSKTIVMLISPSGAGSGADVIARIVADGLTQLWGQQVLVSIGRGAAESSERRLQAQPNRTATHSISR